MNRREGLICYVLVFCTLIGALIVKAAESRSGNWTIQRADKAGEVDLALIEHHHGGNSNHESTIRVSELKGLDLSRSGKQDVHFTITRDAGRFECEGFVNDGEGAGVFHFFEEPRYAQEMKSLGFDDIEGDKQYSMAVMDVSTAFAKEMKAERLEGLDTEKLIAFRIFNVNAAFVEELRKAGLAVTDSDKLVAFRIHGVTPEMVRFLHQAGYQPSEDTLVAMRIHGATPEWMEQLKKDGYEKVDLQQLIAFRIHGVTPEFVSNLRSRGMQNLTIEQLMNLRIHGID